MKLKNKLLKLLKVLY